MNEEAREQIKQDCKRDEAMTRLPPCFIDNLPSVGLVAGAYVCLAHSCCARCGADLRENLAPVGCNCSDYTYGQHEGLLYCGLNCMEAAHPEPDYPESEEEPDGRD